MTDIVEIGTSDPGDDPRPISYAIGPGTVQRMFRVATVPAAFGVAALGIALATLMVVDPAGEIGEVHAFDAGTGGLLGELRWASGLRMGFALLAVVLAVTGIRLMLGARPRLTVGIDDLDADAETLDRMEAEVMAATTSTSPAWMATILGGALVTSVISLAINASAFGYVMATHSPSQNGGLGF